MGTYEYIIVSNHSQSSTRDHYHSVDIYSINRAAADNIPYYCYVESVIVEVKIRHKTVFGTLGNADLNIWLCNNGDDNSGENLYSGKTSTSTVTATADITAKVSGYHSFAINTSYSRLAFYCDSTTSRAYECESFKVIYTFRELNYSGTFRNWDGTVLYGDSYKRLDTPKYNGATPTRPSDEIYDYTFSGWSPEPSPITEHTSYYAQYKAEYRKYYVNVSNQFPNCTVHGAGTYKYGDTVTLSVDVPPSYRVVSWTNLETGEVHYSNTFTFVVKYNNSGVVFNFSLWIDTSGPYVTYDSIFNYPRWENNTLIDWNLMRIDGKNGLGFEATALADDAYTRESRPLIPVEIGKEYVLEVDVETNGCGWQFFVFFCNADGTWGNFAYCINEKKVTFTPTTNWISIRCDIDGTGNTATFENFRMYPSDCPYMGNSVYDWYRVTQASWGLGMPTPTRDGYDFLGWYTLPNGQGVRYTDESPFPENDLTLYSHWGKGISKVFVDTSKVKKAFIDERKVKKIFIDETKVFG